MTIKTKDLTEKAMLVSLTITKWSAKRYDKMASGAVEHEFQAEQKAGRYRKSLAAKEALADINSVVSAARTFHNENTRPWSDDGPRILPSKNYMFYTEKMREFHNKFDDAVRNLVANYSILKDEAKQFLGKLYDEEDYPEVQDIHAKYSFKIAVSPIPTANDFRVTQITDEDVAAIQKQIADRLEEAQKILMKDLWERLHSVVLKAFEAFDDPNATFRNSKIDNIAEMVEILGRLNMDDDPKLARMCKVVEEKLCNLDAKELRDNPEERKDAAADAKKILDTIGSYL